ncbi:hypothetical protein GGF44_006725, partial [Coemansia sp. RSA 1694]
LIDVARQAETLSTKGTCLYALALISRNTFAAEAFREKGWLLCSSCYGSYEFAVPPRLESIFDAGGWATGGLLENTYVFSEDSAKPAHGGEEEEELDSVQKEIIDSVVMMSNHVLVNPSSKALMRLRMSHPHYFRLLPLYLRAMHFLGKFRYRLSTRRFIYDVFDVNLAVLHQEMLNRHHHQTIVAPNDNYKVQGADSFGAAAGGHTSRRFSSSSQHFLHNTATSEIQRKRASTLQEFSSSPPPPSSGSGEAETTTTTTLFPRRPTNGLLDDIRPTMRTIPLSSSAAAAAAAAAPG